MHTKIIITTILKHGLYMYNKFHIWFLIHVCILEVVSLYIFSKYGNTMELLGVCLADHSNKNSESIHFSVRGYIFTSIHYSSEDYYKIQNNTRRCKSFDISCYVWYCKTQTIRTTLLLFKFQNLLQTDLRVTIQNKF